MRTRKIPHNWTNRIRPHVENDLIVYMELPASTVLVDSNIVVIDYFDSRKNLYKRRELHFFLDGPVKVNWNDLTDGQRLTVRTSIPWTIKSIVEGYTDNRYYILEALEEA